MSISKTGGAFIQGPMKLADIDLPPRLHVASCLNSNFIHIFLIQFKKFLQNRSFGEIRIHHENIESF